MTLEVDILDVGSEGGRVEATVAVTETGSENTEYTLEIVDESANVTGGRVVATESGTVFGGSRGTQESFDVSFTPESDEGTFRAEVTEQQGLFDPGAPQRDSDRADFEVSDSGGGPGGEATITILDVDAEPTTVTVVVRIFSLSLGRTDYSGSVSLDWGPDSDFVSISGTVGGGEGADEKTIEFSANDFESEGFLTAALDNGEQEQRTISIPAEPPSDDPTDPPDDDPTDPPDDDPTDPPDDDPGGGGGSVSPSDFQIECSGIPSSVTVGENVSVGYTLLSFTDLAADVEVAVSVGGTTVDTTTVGIGAGGVQQGSIDLVFESTGEADVSLSVASASA